MKQSSDIGYYGFTTLVLALPNIVPAALSPEAVAQRNRVCIVCWCDVWRRPVATSGRRGRGAHHRGDAFDFEATTHRCAADRDLRQIPQLAQEQGLRHGLRVDRPQRY